MQDFLDTDSPSAGPPKTGLSETIRDFEYFSMLCPGKLRGIQAEVKAVCDRLDYQGSPIYDEYPDRVAMEQLSRRIARRVSERLSEEENTALYTAEVRSYSGTVITGNPAPRVRAMETAVPGEAMETGEEGDTESLHMEAVNGRGGPKGPGPARRPWGPPPPPNYPWGPRCRLRIIQAGTGIRIGETSRRFSCFQKFSAEDAKAEDAVKSIRSC